MISHVDIFDVDASMIQLKTNYPEREKLDCKFRVLEELYAILSECLRGWKITNRAESKRTCLQKYGID